MSIEERLFAHSPRLAKGRSDHTNSAIASCAVYAGLGLTALIALDYRKRITWEHTAAERERLHGWDLQYLAGH